MPSDQTTIPELPERLRQVVEAAADGQGDKEIAATLGLSVHTVDTHWRRLREILGTANRGSTIAKYLALRHNADGAKSREQVAALETEARELRERIGQLEATLAEREAASIRIFEEAVRAGWHDVRERERLERLDGAVAVGGTIYYEGEIGGLWRKRWATTNLAELCCTAEEFVEGAVRVTDLIPPEDLLGGHPLFEQTLASGASGLTTYYRVRCKDDQLRWVRDRMTFLRDAAGQATGYFGAVTDIHDLVREDDAPLSWGRVHP